jgi:rod shape-determining protein MreC
MRNLIQLILRYQITLLFLTLEVLAFSLLVSYNSHHQIKYLSATTELTGAFHQTVHDASEYLSLSSVNKELAQENAELRNLMRRNYSGDSEAFQHLIDSAYQQTYNYKEAEVISSTVDKRNNYLLINKGKRNGIKPEMGVICPKGVVGIVKEVSSNYATVMPVLHSQTSISTKLKKNEYFGILKWDGYDPTHAELIDIPSHVELNKGDTLITRGSSGVFPKGIRVGTIEEWEELPAMSFYKIRVKLSTNFYNLSYVYVVDNLHKEEILDLIEITNSNGE